MVISNLGNKSEEWLASMKNKHTELFLIPSVVFSMVTLVTDPVLLTCIFCFRPLRRETRYLLLANTLTCDVIFTILNFTSMLFNTMRFSMLRVVCEVIMVVTVTTYCCSVITVTTMVIDTYLAVRWPLQYHNRVSPSRTRKIIAGLWVLASAYPVSLVVIGEVIFEEAPYELPLCLNIVLLGTFGSQTKVGIYLFFTISVVMCFLVILFCYVRLYMVTRSSGIWQSRFSRARATLSAHGIMLVLYFSPGLVFTVELALYEHDALREELALWLNLVNVSVLMLLPRVFAPYLYGLRYREIYNTLHLLLWRRCQLHQVSVG
ncbi:probable G-protein coupled receptor 148 [Chanos chanos]|uniref:Probable G-protein coupled receptor 148 n=1 Tax=Chanos chanos TaxID=29144 RepID=A0A6J2VDL6_CHACN|nr:probable G-protein coupled receptor 148 [Chanos chanos]